MPQGLRRSPRRWAAGLLLSLLMIGWDMHSARAQDSPALIGEVQTVLVSACVEPTDTGGLLFNDFAIDFASLDSHVHDRPCEICPGECERHGGASWVLAAVGFSVMRVDAPDYTNEQFVSELRFMGMAPSPGAWIVAVPVACVALRRPRRST